MNKYCTGINIMLITAINTKNNRRAVIDVDCNNIASAWMAETSKQANEWRETAQLTETCEGSKE